MIDLYELIKNNQIESYSNVATKSQIGGSLNKKFARVHSSVFDNLWNDIEKGKVHYQTYINDFIKDGSRIDFVSCLIKDVRKDKAVPQQMRLDRELATMKLADMIGIPCTYSIPAKKGNKLNLISIDYVPYGYKVESLTNFLGGLYLDSYMPLEEFEAEAFSAFFSANKEIPDAQKFDYVQHQVELLLEQLFFKKYINGDADVCSDNVAVFVKSGRTKVSPLFDNEYAFSNRMPISRLEEDMRFLYNKYPNVLDKILKFSDKSFKQGFKNVKEGLATVVTDELYLNKIVLFVAQNLSQIDVMFRGSKEESDSEINY